MPIRSYLVFPDAGQTGAVADRLSALPGCDVVPAENREVLLLVTETEDAAAEEALRRRLESVDGVRAMVLAFGDVDPDTPLGDPLARGRRRHRADDPLAARAAAGLDVEPRRAR